MAEPAERSDIGKRVDELCRSIQAATEELRAIRAACAHPTYRLGWWSWGPGRINASRICNECHDALPGITDDEHRELGPFGGKARA